MSGKKVSIKVKRKARKANRGTVSDVQRDLQVIAIAASDLHFCHKPPIARSAEPDWYAAQRSYIEQLTILTEQPIKYQSYVPAPTFKVPIFCAGDLLDRWQSTPELVNFLLTYLPEMYAIPGQHDLPAHRYEDLHKSAFYTLVKAGKITLVEPNSPVIIPGYNPIRLHGFPWNKKVTPLKDPHDLFLEIALIHKYVWIPGCSHPNALGGKIHSPEMKESLAGYDIAICGDNHISFDTKANKCLVANIGGFMRRRSDERSHKPSVGLIMSDGTVKRQHLDTSKDKFLEAEDVAKIMDQGGFESFMEELQNLGESAVDFAAAVRMILRSDHLSTEAKVVLLNALENAES